MQYQEKQEVQKKSLCWKYSSFIIHNCGKYLVCLLTHRTLKCLHLGDMQLPENVPTKNAWACQKHICTLQGILYYTEMVHTVCLAAIFARIFDLITGSGGKIPRCCGWK